MFVDLVLGERLAGLLIKLQVVPHATQGTQSFYFDFFCCNETLTKNSLRKERVYLACRFHCIIKGSQGRSSRQDGEAESTEECWSLPACF